MNCVSLSKLLSFMHEGNDVFVVVLFSLISRHLSSLMLLHCPYVLTCLTDPSTLQRDNLPIMKLDDSETCWLV